MENLFNGFSKQKNMKRLSFITQFKIEFLLLFTGCRKVLGKMPYYVSKDQGFFRMELQGNRIVL